MEGLSKKEKGLVDIDNSVVIAVGDINGSNCNGIRNTIKMNIFKRLNKTYLNKSGIEKKQKIHYHENDYKGEITCGLWESEMTVQERMCEMGLKGRMGS